MPVSKVKWGGDWVDSLEQDDDDTGEGYAPYEGPRAPKGVYLAKVRMVPGQSKNENDQVIVHFNLVGAFKPEHRRFDGYYWRDYITFTPKTGFKTRPFLKALGVTPREFHTQTGVDDNGNIRQIGKRKFGEEFMMVVMIRPDTKNNPDYEETRYIRTATPEDLKGAGQATDSGDVDPVDEDEDALPTPF